MGTSVLALAAALIASGPIAMSASGLACMSSWARPWSAAASPERLSTTKLRPSRKPSRASSGSVSACVISIDTSLAASSASR
jgi:hypothetical protein